jgi:general stress protein 26
MGNVQKVETVGSLAELHRLLREFDTAMLVTVSLDGRIKARPMALQDPAICGDCDLWFVTADDCPKTDEIHHERQVNVCCFRARDQAYLSISAMARIDTTVDEVHRLWKPEWKLWLPDDPADGAIALLKLTVERAEYWQPEGGRSRTIYESGQPGEADRMTRSSSV